MNRAYKVGIGLFLVGWLGPLLVNLWVSVAAGTIVWAFEGDILVIWPFTALPAFWDNMVGALVGPLLFLVSGLVGGYLLAPMYLWFHRFFFGRRSFYSILDRDIQPSLKRWLRRGILPTLFAFYVTMMLAKIIVSTPSLLTVILAPELIAIEPPLTLESLSWTFTMILGILVTTALIAPTWFLDDAGVIASNVELTRTPLSVRKELPTIMGVGTWLARFLKGFAGIAVVLIYTQHILQIVIQGWSYVITIGPEELPFFLSHLVLLPLHPLLTLFLTLPLLMFLDYIVDQRKRYVTNMSKRFGITPHVEKEAV